MICTICWSAIESFDSFYKSIEIAHNIQRDYIHEDELSFASNDALEPKVSIEQIILQPKVEPPENEIESTLVDPVDEQVGIQGLSKKRLKKKIQLEKSDENPSISPTRRSARNHKYEVKEEVEIEILNTNSIELTNVKIRNQSDDDYEPIDDVYEPNEPSDIESDECEEDLEIKKAKSKRRLNTESVDEQSKPKRKYKKLTPEEKEAKKNKTSSKQMKICAEWDQFLADFGFIFKCKICDFIGSDFRELKGHFRVAHDKPRGYAMCCDRIFYKKEILVEHIQFHINPEHFKCNNCGMTFKASKSLEYHSIHTCKSINTEDVKKLFQCDECLKWFNSKFLLQRHKLSHMPLEERQWKCTVADCGKL